eukprot:TRINITY_DN3647_c0_g2_i5.p2 TRINITY_DN3647_c0_g2~~TRINITY_DN3647_c0_g2_i5.p2  ORF type:complete len:136 (-),score=24.51 TRINITY_DN3647_c0_g2_i5:451-858(-)
MSTTTTLNVPTGPKKKGKVKREKGAKISSGINAEYGSTKIFETNNLHMSGITEIELHEISEEDSLLTKPNRQQNLRCSKLCCWQHSKDFLTLANIKTLFLAIVILIATGIFASEHVPHKKYTEYSISSRSGALSF